MEKEINLFTGGKGGVGKTLIALCLSTYFLNLGHKTLLVDFNVFNPDLYSILRKLAIEKEKKIDDFLIVRLEGNSLLVVPSFDVKSHYKLPLGIADFYQNYLNKIWHLDIVKQHDPDICLVDTGYHIANLALPSKDPTEHDWLEAFNKPKIENLLHDKRLNIWFLWTLHTLERELERDAIEVAVEQFDKIGIGQFNRPHNLRHVFNPYSLYPEASLIRDLNRIIQKIFRVRNSFRDMVNSKKGPDVPMNLNEIMQVVSNEIKTHKKGGYIRPAKYAHIVCNAISEYAPTDERPQNFFPVLTYRHLKNYTSELESTKKMTRAQLTQFLGPAYELFAKYLAPYYRSK